MQQEPHLVHLKFLQQIGIKGIQEVLHLFRLQSYQLLPRYEGNNYSGTAKEYSSDLRWYMLFFLQNLFSPANSSLTMPKISLA